MKNPVYKFIELTGTSTASIKDAVDKAINARKKPSRTCAGFRWSKRAAASKRGRCISDRAREVYHIPEHFEAWTAMAFGYKVDLAKLARGPERARLVPRQRKPLN